ncbi:hypothetical protein [Streptomyces mirabilis]
MAMLLVPTGTAQAAPGDNPNKVILSGWGQNGTTTDHMGRIAFIDANDPSNFKYRWVLPVIPLNGGTDYRALKSRMGGMVWYQDKLIVTSWEKDSDNNVMYIFDMKRILRATVNSEPGYLATDSSSHVNASAAYETNAVGLQGVLSHSATSGGTPNFYVDDARGGVGQHTESMSYWWSTGRVRMLTEWAADSTGHWTGTDTAILQRVLFSVPLSWMDSSLG